MLLIDLQINYAIIYTVGQKYCTLFISAITLSTTVYFDNFWHTDTEVNLQENHNKIAYLSWWLFSPYLVKRNIRQFVYNSSSVRFKSHDSYGETHHSKCSVFAFDFETCIKTIFPLISCLLNEALLVADHVSVRCCFSSLTSLTGFW